MQPQLREATSIGCATIRTIQAVKMAPWTARSGVQSGAVGGAVIQADRKYVAEKPQKVTAAIASPINV